MAAEESVEPPLQPHSSEESAEPPEPAVDNGESEPTPQQQPFCDLTRFVSAADLADLDAYLLGKGVLGPLSGFGTSPEDGVADVSVFPADGLKYGDCLELCDRDTSTWCGDAFVSYSGADDFKQCRAHRGDPCTWRHNGNALRLPGVINFVRKLPFFEQTGKIAIILNAPDEPAVEHCDHAIADLVSEFVWVRPAASTKRFFVRHPDTSERDFVLAGARVGWFDDSLRHCLDPNASMAQFSIRIDGRFTPRFRAHLCNQGVFANRGDGHRGADVLAGQGNGPAFLAQYNSPPGSDDE
jgi:hypothetical protein